MQASEAWPTQQPSWMRSIGPATTLQWPLLVLFGRFYRNTVSSALLTAENQCALLRASGCAAVQGTVKFGACPGRSPRLIIDNRRRLGPAGSNKSSYHGSLCLRCIASLHLESPRYVTPAPFPRPASASHLPPNSPTLLRDASSVLVLPVPPAPFLFLAISLTRVCASHPYAIRPLAQGLRFAAGLPGMGRHAFGPPAARRCISSSRDTTHFFTVPLRPY